MILELEDVLKWNSWQNDVSDFVLLSLLRVKIRVCLSCPLDMYFLLF